MTTTFRPLRSGPRPMSDEAKRSYKDLLNKLSTLARDMVPGHFHCGQIDNRFYPTEDAMVRAFIAEAQPYVNALNAIADRVKGRIDQIRAGAGEGSLINYPGEVLQLLPECRVTGGPDFDNAYGRLSFALAFPAKKYPRLAKLESNKYPGSAVSHSRDERCLTPEQEEWDRLEAHLEPLRQRGFDAYMSLKRVTKTSLLVSLTVSEPRS